MRIERIETIYLTQEEDIIIRKMYKLLEEISKETENKEIEKITDNIKNYLYDLNQYIEIN